MKRWLWFMAIWASSVACLALIAWLLRRLQYWLH
ncbi:MAG: hypothetical protein ACKO0Z_23780 [Betaproteobacteria bacterium]